MTENLSIQTIMSSQTYKQTLEAAYDEMEKLTKKWDDECHWCESSKELPTFKWFYTHEDVAYSRRNMQSRMDMWLHQDGQTLYACTIHGEGSQ